MVRIQPTKLLWFLGSGAIANVRERLFPTRPHGAVGDLRTRYVNKVRELYALQFPALINRNKQNKARKFGRGGGDRKQRRLESQGLTRNEKERQVIAKER
jgi:hypothetical protein